MNFTKIYNQLPSVIIISENLDEGEMDLKSQFEIICDDAGLDKHEEFENYANAIVERGGEALDENTVGVLTLLLYLEDMDLLIDNGMDKQSELTLSVGEETLFAGTYEGLIQKYWDFLVS